MVFSAGERVRCRFAFEFIISNYTLALFHHLPPPQHQSFELISFKFIIAETPVILLYINPPLRTSIIISSSRAARENSTQSSSIANVADGHMCVCVSFIHFNNIIRKMNTQLRVQFPLYYTNTHIDRDTV